MKRILTLILSLSLAACSPTRAAMQPATRTPSPQPTATAPAAATEPAKICKVTADALHIRSGPGVGYSVIGYLYAGEIVTIQDQRGAWFDIGAGWINSKYCQE